MKQSSARKIGLLKCPCCGKSRREYLPVDVSFDRLYNTCSEAEQRDLMRAIIDRIDLYPEKPKDGCWIRKIVFNFPVPVNGEEVKEFPLENQTMLEAVCFLSNR